MKRALWGAVVLLVGCATGTGGPVEIGRDTYMIGGLGLATDFSGSAVKARFFKQGAEFCASKGRAMVPLDSVSRDSGFGTYASAEVQFKCAASG